MQVEAICSRLRLLVQDCLDKHLYATAVFYADKLVALSKSAPSDVYLVAQVRAQHNPALLMGLRSPG